MRFANLLMRKNFPPDLLYDVLSRLKDGISVDQNEVRLQYDAAICVKKRKLRGRSDQHENQVVGKSELLEKIEARRPFSNGSGTAAARAVVDLIFTCCQSSREELARLFGGANPEEVGRMLSRRLSAEDAPPCAAE